jgi:hypothetical protein
VPQYSIAFAAQLVKAADLVVQDGLDDPEAKRTVLYLALLSTEVSLKAMLEKAGVDIKAIRSRSHDLAILLHDLSHCLVGTQVELGQNMKMHVTLQGQTLNFGDQRSTISEILGSEKIGASRYPNDVRYGALPTHHSPEIVLQMAKKIMAFATQHWETLYHHAQPGAQADLQRRG